MSGIQYLMALCYATGSSVRSSRRWLSVMGMVITALSVIQMVPLLLTKQRYILTYKLSQDHLELFFGTVRRMGGWSNSPTALQFSKIWRQLIRRAGVKTGNNGNVQALDSTCIISAGHGDVAAAASVEQTDIPDDESLLLHLEDIDDMTSMTPLIRNVTCYIAGWAVRKASQLVNCDVCVDAMTTTTPPDDLTECYCLIKKKNFVDGALRTPSKAVLRIAFATERAIRAHCGSRTNPTIQARICSAVVSAVGAQGGFQLDQHDRDTMYGIETHSATLTRTIASLYYRVRQHHIARLKTQRLQAGNKRKTLNKLTLFRGH